MKRSAWLPATLILTVIAGLIGWIAFRAHAHDSVDSPCILKRFEGVTFTVCAYHSASDKLQILLDSAGRPIGNLATLERVLGSQASLVRFAMNGGMYDSSQRPVGLLVQDGNEIHPTNLGSGSGNFFLIPNGVFHADLDGTVHVEDSRAYQREQPPARWATQSGPLLLEGGILHPAIAPNGQSLAVRNGVGIRSPTLAYFVISNGKVSFGRMARFFRDALGCREALYLDGAVSSLWAPSLGRQDGQNGLGPLIVVSKGTRRPSPP